MKIHKQEGLNPFFHRTFSTILHGTGGVLLLVLYDKTEEILNLDVSEV